MTQSIGQCRLKLSRGNGYSKGQADHIARAMCLRGKQVEAYLCDHCGLWHVGRRFKKTPKRKGQAMADDFTDAEVDILLERFDQTDPKLQRRIVAQLVADRERLTVERDKLAAFKAFAHARLDAAGVPPEFPDGPHSKEGCRIGDRLDWLQAERDRLRQEIDRLTAKGGPA